MRSLRTTRNARVFFASNRSLIASSRADDTPWLSGVTMGQSLPGHSEAIAPSATASPTIVMAPRIARAALLRSSSVRLPFVAHFCRGLNLIVFECDLTSLFLDVDADGLLAGFGGAGVADDVVSENKVPGLAAHADAGGVTFAAVVLNEVVLDPVAVRSHAGGF